VRQYRPDENRRSQMGQQQPCQLAGCLTPELSWRRTLAYFESMRNARIRLRDP
jgi:hypothetical protein